MSITVKALCALTLFLCLNFGASAQFDADDSYMNDIQPIEVSGKFEPLGEDIAGDSLEHDRGTLSLRHVDVSIPGNSQLPVEFARNYTIHGTAHTGNQLGGWQVDVPYITVRMSNGGFAPGGPGHSHFSTDGCFLNSWDRAFTNPGDVSAYYQGFKMNIPGEGLKQVMDVPSGAAVNFPYDNQYDIAATTTDHWQIYCEAGGGSPTGAVIAISPTGDKYEFRTLSATFAGFEVITKSSGGRRGNMYQAPTFTYHFNLMATKVTDVHGNWVAYDYENEFDYDQNYEICTVYVPAINGYACADNLRGSNYASYRLKTIRSNDGRRIDVAYNSANYDPIVPSLIQTPEEGFTTTVSSVTANGRTWTYVYETPSGAGGAMNAFRVLRRVNLPDGRHWYLNLPLQNHRAYRHYNSYRCNAIDSSNYTRPWVMHWLSDVYVKHPSGARVDFDFQLIKNPIWKLGTLSTITNSLACNNPDPEFTISNALTRKTITAPSSPTAIWNFSYDQTAFNDASLGEVKRRTETRPDGSTVERMVLINNEGDTVRKTASGSGVSYVEKTVITKIATFDEYDTSVGVLDDHKRYKNPTLKRPTQIDITSEGDAFRTVTAYNTNLASSSYSYGAPTSVTQTGTGSGSRSAVINYLQERDDWVLSRVNTITKNGKLFDDFDYDSKGRVTRHKKFGVTLANIGYHQTGNAAGRVRTVSDALNRTYTVNGYKRGTPTSIQRPDGNSVTRIVDNNGWITSENNARNHTTTYQYNNMGWLTRIDRPGSWADTVISYSGLGSGLTQTSTRGNSRTVNTLDGYHRTILSKSEDLTGNASAVYNKTSYDGLGRAIYYSFPSNSSSAPNGVDTTYDALGRVTQKRENVAPHSTTSFSYLSGGRVRKTDATGAQTTTTYQSYGSPSMNEATLVQQPEGISTTMSYDSWGNIVSAVQGGFTQIWTYDSRLRVCNHHTPEQGGTIYAYNNANEVVHAALGQGTGCSSSSGDRVHYSYDPMGRQNVINYPGSTADISLNYDPNGNVTQNTRGGVTWTYSYNELDLLTQEVMTIDGRTYSTTYGYNSTGHRSTENTPGGLAVSYVPNGLGQATKAGVGSYNYAHGVSYHPNGAVKYMTFGNTRGYDSWQNDRQLTSRIHYWYGFIHHLSYDAEGRITSIDDQYDNSRDRTYSYDDLGRLETANGAWGAGTFQYDAVNNLTRKQLGSRIVEVQFDSNNRVSRARDSAAGNTWQNYVHDSRGNVIDNGPSNFAYDAAMQPISITGAQSGAFIYDGLHKRAKQTINGEEVYSVYASSGQLKYRDNKTTGVKTDFIRVGDMLVASSTNQGTKTYLHQDHLGSTLKGAESANVTWNEHYTPFGEKWSSASQAADSIGYTGHIMDSDNGLTYMQARYYDPVIGRFLSVDPVGFLTGGTDHFNRYAYISNDPVNGTDPSGMHREEDWEDEWWDKPAWYDENGNCHGSCGPDNSGSSSDEPLFNEFGGPAGTSIDPRTNGAAEDGSFEVMGVVLGFKGIDKGFKAMGAWAMGKEVAEEVAENATKRMADDIAEWLGEGFVVRRHRGNFTATSSDGLRRFRVDFFQTKGKFRGPHAQFESRRFVNRPYTPVDGVPDHIYFKP